MARLLTKYRDDVVPGMMERFEMTNLLSVPRLQKITISMGIGKANEQPKLLQSASDDMTKIAGQKSVLTRAKKSVSNFRLREGYVVGCMVTLRGPRMYEFMDRLVSIVIPRIRDFRGLKLKSFDQAGNFSMGLAEQTVFPEILSDKIEASQGMNITFTIGNSNPEQSLALLRMLGMPFKNPEEAQHG